MASLIKDPLTLDWIICYQAQHRKKESSTWQQFQQVGSQSDSFYESNQTDFYGSPTDRSLTTRSFSTIHIYIYSRFIASHWDSYAKFFKKWFSASSIVLKEAQGIPCKKQFLTCWQGQFDLCLTCSQYCLIILSWKLFKLMNWSNS